jgi:hypothetical protein
MIHQEHVLYNVSTEFRIIKELVRLIEMFMYKVSGIFHIDKHLCDVFAVQKGMIYLHCFLILLCIKSSGKSDRIRNI